MADPSVMAYRNLLEYDTDGNSPDSILLGGNLSAGSCLPAGTGPIIELYYTGLSVGQMLVDSGAFPDPRPFLFVTQYSGTYVPELVPLTVSVIDGNLPPVLTIGQNIIRDIGGATISFSISGESPDGFPISFSINSIAGFDDPTVIPTNIPTISEESPIQIEWITTPSDIGIWEMVIDLCDSTASCVTSSVQIQLVESLQYISDFEIISNFDYGSTSGIVIGDFDNDGRLELFTSLLADGIAYDYPSSRLYDFDEANNPVSTYEGIFGLPKFGPLAGYFDGDEFLDIALMSFNFGTYELLVLLGDGNNYFSESEVYNLGNNTRSSALGEFTGDNHLDIVSTWYDGVHIYSGNSQSGFAQAQYIPIYGVSATSVNTADFNNDGRDDLAVGTTEGINIYLAEPDHQFTLTNFYPQEYGSLNIEVTNRGSDFNNDNIFDLCISTPSIGGQRSEMIVYLGNGDGSFNGNIVRNVQGQIFGNCVADFNNDGQLDIAFVNGTLRYLSILFGDDNGDFPNEIRHEIPSKYASAIECLDVDLDGDMDIAILTYNPDKLNAIFVYLNQSNPEQFTARSLDINIKNNAALKIISPTGLIFNSVKNSMPSGITYRRNLDANNIIDASTQLGTVEEGLYVIEVSPRPELAPGELFSLEFELEGDSYRLANDIPMPPEGYQYALYADTVSNILPRPGSYIHIKQPALVWPGDGEFNLQLSDSPDFENLLLNVLIEANNYTLDSPLEISDTTTFYWRTKPSNQPDYDMLSVFNLIPGDDPSCGDANSDEIVNIGDAVFLINLVFKGGPSPDPMSNGDANCDGNVNIADGVYLINFVFKGGDPPCCP